MKNKLFALFCFLCPLQVSLFGQYSLSLRPTYDLIYENDELPKGLEGSPYLTDDWTIGKVLMKNGSPIQGLLLRYNYYKHQMQYKLNNTVYIIGAPDSIKELTMMDKKFIYSSFTNDKNVDKSFFEIALEGKIALLINFVPEIIRSNYDIAHDVGNRNDQLTIKKIYFVEIDNQIVPLDKKGTVLTTKFPDKATELNEFVKTHHLNYTKEKDIFKIINYLNSLI